MPATTRPIKRQHFEIRGQVQGVGFRSYVYRLARRCSPTGHVANGSSGAVVEVEGSSHGIETFAEALLTDLPPLARVGQLDRCVLPAAGVTVLFASVVGLARPTTTTSSGNRTGTSQPARTSTAADKTQAVNPHWTDAGCRHCHQVAGDKVKPIKPARIDGLCWECHDGKRAGREGHPVGRQFSPKQLARPEDWPLVGGRLSCVSCHDIRSACRRGRPRPADNSVFLRRYDANNPLAFCAHCHVRDKSHDRHNPHIMLTEEKKPAPQACRFCHEPQVDQREHFERTGEAALKADEITLCLSCHTHHVDYFEPGHMGVKVGYRMKAYMVAAESTPASQRVGIGAIMRAARARRAPSRLPLAAGDRVVCSTCHNPHQEGTFPAGSASAHGGLTFGKHDGRRAPADVRSAPLRLRGLGWELCLACHNK